MNFQNATVYGTDFHFHENQTFAIKEGKFVPPDEAMDQAIDCHGLYAIPGLIDLHTHGNSNVDFTKTTDPQQYGVMMRYLARKGITSCLFGSTTASEEQLRNAFALGADYCDNPLPGAAYPHGFYMEGPFLSDEKKGAQLGNCLRKPDVNLFDRLNSAAKKKIRIVCIAPETENALQFIHQVSPGTVVSLAHTNADYDQAREALEAGASHVTHLFNAMPPLHHRKPGVVGAAWENPQTMVELICDGIHVHPSMIKLTMALFGTHRVCFVSDSSFMCGLPDGAYMRDTRMVHMKDGLITLEDGTIAGSATCLFEGLRRAISFGIDQEQAIRCATWNPAKAIGVEKITGSIAPGLNADFVLCDKQFAIQAVYVKGIAVDKEADIL
ncbi:MAG: N-acetylglucosamine-6-phosphate deacetylase [Clostridia bacterium]